MGDKPVRVAIIGVGNCANSLIQGVEYYKNAGEDEFIPGVMHATLGAYHIGNIEFSAAIDVDVEKVGKDLSEAIWSGQNNTIKFAKYQQFFCAFSIAFFQDVFAVSYYGMETYE